MKQLKKINLNKKLKNKIKRKHKILIQKLISYYMNKKIEL